ncbi:Ubiquitin-conjugating enzyme E2 8 [Spatholobus suberectus]|nr:Ubiquitin-conjugating enzyme E2 8 [Spatholobus suberectus]
MAMGVFALTFSKTNGTSPLQYSRPFVICSLLTYPNTKDPLMPEVVHMYKNDRAKYEGVSDNYPKYPQVPPSQRARFRVKKSYTSVGY